MKLITCGTGSTGNTYLLTDGKETLVIDAGIPFREVKKALNFEILSIKGVIVTHGHGDHQNYVHEYEAAGIPIFRPYTMENLRQKARFGNFTVQSFDCVHSVPCVGYLISHQDGLKMLYATDTEYVKYTFRGLTAMLIEANWSEEYVERGRANYFHTLTGHMELQTTIGCVEANDNPKLRHVILCHLSARNSDPQAFREAVEAVVGLNATVHIAEKGKTIELADTPF